LKLPFIRKGKKTKTGGLTFLNSVHIEDSENKRFSEINERIAKSLNCKTQLKAFLSTNENVRVFNFPVIKRTKKYGDLKKFVHKIE
jgi:hypothetical protein